MGKILYAGGEPWLNQELPDPICGGALLSLSDGKMAFVNCAYGDEPALERQKQGESVRWSLDARQKLTIRLSKDDGVTWNDGLMIAEEGEHRILQERMRLLAFTRKAGRMETVFLIRDYRWRLFLWFCYDWGGKRYISEREKELYRSVFSAYFIYYAVYCVFSSFIVLFLTEQGYSATVCGIITSLTFFWPIF